MSASRQEGADGLLQIAGIVGMTTGFDLWVWEKLTTGQAGVLFIGSGAFVVLVGISTAVRQGWEGV